MAQLQTNNIILRKDAEGEYYPQEIALESLPFAEDGEAITIIAKPMKNPIMQEFYGLLEQARKDDVIPERAFEIMAEHIMKPEIKGAELDAFKKGEVKVVVWQAMFIALLSLSTGLPQSHIKSKMDKGRLALEEDLKKKSLETSNDGSTEKTLITN